MVAGAGQAAGDRGVRAVIATRADVERVDVAGEVELPVTRTDIDRGEIGTIQPAALAAIRNLLRVFMNSPGILS